jgi:hypothetical protein
MGDRKAVYTVSPRGEGKKDFWCRIGTAFTNRDGSLSVVLDANPVNGRLIVRDEELREERREEPSPARPARRAPQQPSFDERGQSDDEIPF